MDQNFIGWIMDNKNWIFSGAGVALIGAIIGVVFHRRKVMRRGQLIKSGDKSTSIQAGNGATIILQRDERTNDERQPHEQESSKEAASQGSSEYVDPETGNQPDEYLECLAGLEIEFQDIALNELSFHSIDRQLFLNLLNTEFRSHPLFAQMDYESLPLPLKDGHSTIITKLREKVTIEGVSKGIVKKDIFDVWSNLARLYFQAYRLPFRSDPNVILKGLEFQRTMYLLEKLIVAAQEYIYKTRLFDDKDVRMICHRLKGLAGLALSKARHEYNRIAQGEDVSSSISRIVINFDLVVSSIHKLLVQYRAPK